MPKVSMAAVMSLRGRWNTYLSSRYQPEISSRPRPTTVKPMTVPAEKATFKPEFRLSRQALAVRELEAVAIFMPTKPLRPEKKPPEMKAKGTNHVRKWSAAIRHRITNMQAKNTRTTLYCLRR